MKKIIFFLMIISCTSLLADNQLNHNPLLTQYIVRKQVLENENFCLFDVGASGGIAKYWEAFGKILKGFGFDPLLNECERLNAKNNFPNFCYIPSYIISGDEKIDSYQDPICSSWFARSSAHNMQVSQKINYAKEIFNQGADLVFSTKKTSLDAFCKENKVEIVDFIKIDTDGFDYCVLKGAENLLSNQNTLGVLIETNYNGALHPYANCFRNVDSFLVEKEFRLFDLSVHRYSKKDLPGKFVYTIPAQSVNGQACWGDVLYLRDLVEMKKNKKNVSIDQVLKMACLMEIFGLADCAAELLIAFKTQLSAIVDVDHCLDLLAKDINLFTSYQEHLREFQENPAQFYP